MLEAIKKYLNLSIVMSVSFVILGIILIVWPRTSLDIISYIIATFLIICGIYNFIDSFKINPIFSFIQITSSTLSLVLGITLFLNPTLFEKLIPIVLGILFIVNGSFKARISFILKETTSNWWLSLILSILTIICGILLLVNPSISMIMITTLIGIILVAYALSDIIDTIIFKGYIKDISKYFDKLLK